MTTRTLIAAMDHLVDEFDSLEGVVSRSAQNRRTLVLEETEAALFLDLNTDLDPNDSNYFDADAAEVCLKFCLFVSNLLATTLLDYREQASLAGLNPEHFRGGVLLLLVDIWDTSKRQFLGEED